MEKKDIVKYFYETVVSENLLDEVPHYVSEDCVVKSGETILPVGVRRYEAASGGCKEDLPGLYNEDYKAVYGWRLCDIGIHNGRHP